MEYLSENLPHLRDSLRLLLSCWDISFEPLPNLVLLIDYAVLRWTQYKLYIFA